MNTHHFEEEVKVQRFCLTLLGKARLWFQSLEPLEDTTWPQLQNLFRQRYLKLGNTCEQLFHEWRSFTSDENAESIDSYVICIRQVATLLGYGEPQILEVFKNTLPTKLYWILIQIENLRQAIDTAKTILTKEKLDKQLTGQTSTSPFMSIKDGTERRVSFNDRDELGDKIDKLTVMMNRLVMKDALVKRPFKPQIYKSRGYHRSYGQGNYQSRLGSRNRGQFMDNRPRQNYRGCDNNKINEMMTSLLVLYIYLIFVLIFLVAWHYNESLVQVLWYFSVVLCCVLYEGMWCSDHVVCEHAVYL